ncbi:MAG: ABC transporter permease [Cyanobacteria bacterium P01_A01_bin.40]
MKYHKKMLPRRLIYLYDLLSQLLIRELKLKYKRSILGIAWTLINPLLKLIVFALIFRSVLTIETEHYAAFVFCGLLVWNWFQDSLTETSGIIVDSTSLIQQPGFPLAILPVVVIMNGMIHFLLALPILGILLLLEGVKVKLGIIIWLPILMILQFILTISLGYIFAAINVIFRDTQYTVGVLLQICFFLTPIFYDISNIEVPLIYNINPLVHLVTAYRNVLIQGVYPEWKALGIIAIFSITFLFFSQSYFRLQSHHFLEEL